jgi:hypothetical protein
MIQITKFLNPDEIMWRNNRKISILEWMEIERKKIQKKTRRKTKIVTLNGKVAIFRDRIK